MKKIWVFILAVSLFITTIWIPQTEPVIAAGGSFEVKAPYSLDSKSKQTSTGVYSQYEKQAVKPITLSQVSDPKSITKVNLLDDKGNVLQSVAGNGTKTYRFEPVSGKKIKVSAKSQPSGKGGYVVWDRTNAGKWFLEFQGKTIVSPDHPSYKNIPRDKYGLASYPSNDWIGEGLFAKVPAPSKYKLPDESFIESKYVAGININDPISGKPTGRLATQLEVPGYKWEPPGKFRKTEGVLQADLSTNVYYEELYDYVDETISYNPNGGAMGAKYYSVMVADYYAVVYSYPNLKAIVYTAEGCTNPNGCSPPQEPSEGSCTSPVPRGTVSAAVMDPSATGKIRADNRGSEKFDVLQGIPTSETLYANVLAKEYLYKNKFVEMVGTCTYPVKVVGTWHKTWTEKKDGPKDPITGVVTKLDDPKEKDVSFEKEHQIKRNYSYWQIDNLEVYGIQESELQNYALPDGRVTLSPMGYDPPSVAVEHSDSRDDHIQDPDYLPIIDMRTIPVPGGATEPPDPPNDYKGEAENNTGKVKVTNDYLKFNNTTVIDNSQAKESGPAPGTIPSPKQTGQDVLYENDLLVENTKVNQANTTSTGTIQYELIESVNGGAPQSFPVNGLNTVTVHTPVVMYPSVSDDQEHNQKVVPTSGRAAVILDRPFTVTLPTSGQHNSYPGYGNRDYAKYTANKQVLFEFDVFNQDKSKYIPANTWIDIPVGQLNTTFVMPVWVDEGYYTVHFRSIAENAPTGFTWQNMANFNWQNHVAINTVPVEVIGRLYNFKITDIGDFDWETVFRKKVGSSQPTGAKYWVGTGDIDGDPRGNKFPYVLPIRPGSHPNNGFKNVTIKTGYHFKFDFETKGNMFGAQDRVRITPTFYFVNKDGSGRKKVDLYYHDQTNKKYFIKIGSADDKVQRSIVLNDKMRNIPSTELSDTAGYVSSYGFRDYLKQSNKKSSIGGYGYLSMNDRVRTLIGPKTNLPSIVNQPRALAAVQKWYGEYSLPAAPYVVAAGTNIAEYGRTHGGLTDKSPIFLKNGYIIVNFNIETYRNGSGSPYLRYYRLPGQNVPLDNQWQMEGYENTAADKYGHKFSVMDGDVVFYHGDLSSYDDFQSNVPH